MTLKSEPILNTGYSSKQEPKTPTRQPPSSDMIRIERAFQIYLALLNSRIETPYVREDVLINLARISFDAANIFIIYSEELQNSIEKTLTEFVAPTYFDEDPAEPID